MFGGYIFRTAAFVRLKVAVSQEIITSSNVWREIISYSDVCRIYDIGLRRNYFVQNLSYTLRSKNIFVQRRLAEISFVQRRLMVIDSISPPL